MEKVVEQIMQRLDCEVKELQFIDIDLNQFLLSNPPVSFPCALVDVETVQYSNLMPSYQLGKATIKVTLGFREYSPSDVDSDPEDRKWTLLHYGILKKVSDCLHGYSTELFTPLNRVQLSRSSQVYPRIFSVIFTTEFKDVTKESESQLTRPAFQLKI